MNNKNVQEADFGLALLRKLLGGKLPRGEGFEWNAIPFAVERLVEERGLAGMGSLRDPAISSSLAILSLPAFDGKAELLARALALDGGMDLPPEIVRHTMLSAGQGMGEHPERIALFIRQAPQILTALALGPSVDATAFDFLGSDEFAWWMFEHVCSPAARMAADYPGPVALTVQDALWGGVFGVAPASGPGLNAYNARKQADKMALSWMVMSERAVLERCAFAQEGSSQAKPRL